jgi:hypothetical protein
MIIGMLAAGVALLAAMWMLALSPKRTENAKVKSDLTTEEQRLSAAQAELASNQNARKQYKGMLAELQRLDKAVPARGDIPGLLRELQKRARAGHSELRLAALKSGGGAAGAAAAGASAGSLTPGATPRPGGLAALPFSFTYAGKYFDLVHVLAAARKAVTVKSGDVKIDGRLVTIEGVSFAREDPNSPVIKASVSGTAYIAVAATPPPSAAVAAAPAQGGA